MNGHKTEPRTLIGQSLSNAELDDKRDAERFRWILDNCTDFMRPINGVLTNGRFRYKRGSCFSPREAIDNAMEANLNLRGGLTAEQEKSDE